MRGGPVLGVVPDTEYREETFTLDEDSALVMVTDGVVEGPGLTLEARLERNTGRRGPPRRTQRRGDRRPHPRLRGRGRPRRRRSCSGHPTHMMTPSVSVGE
ncbi:SpoIIE family protein phosphatase [Streptomyces sp. NPDC056192]|uniref:SpoIIE family protein phosphatase n=1 Tax=unclassified Streptomyces TaxID=2593676 RepID=UPI0035D94298